ncbi:MAG: polyprenyl synthetase family protein [Ilumatobacteraceae bacterium]|nr:polyprenyl synthetase family protein [Ilumatobacteraceae bacterium]
MSLPSPLLVHVGDQRDRIERAMLASVTTTDAHLTELASHLIVAGGKRLRPVLTVIAGSLDGRAVTDDVVLGGVSCELVHLGSLYHDDVMDESETRRGVETVNARWGNLQAILAGDFLLARASEIAAGLGTEVAGLLARTIGWLCEGQIEELRHTYDVGRTEESYLASIHGKTASLYGTAARVGGIVAGLSDEEIDALTDFGNAYGMVFQVVDDLLDLTATDEQLGKRAGHDMEVGVYTLPVIHTLSVGSAELESLLGGPLHGPEAERALEIVRSGPGIESTISRARDFVNDAVRACSALPEGPARSALEEAPAALLASALSPTA